MAPRPGDREERTGGVIQELNPFSREPDRMKRYRV